MNLPTDPARIPAMTRSLLTLTTLALLAAPLAAQPPEFVGPPAPPAATAPAADKLPLSGLAPAKLVPNLCTLSYRISTRSPECQKFFDQGLGYFYSYVWMEAARSFETAARHDPDCAMAWWGLARAFDEWRRGSSSAALDKAQALLPKASDREQRLITAKLQEKGKVKDIPVADRRKAATKTIDELLTLYDDDQEAWFARAKLSENAGDRTAAVPFHKALLRINPVHPGASHELVHYYELSQRPALGWPYAEAYIASSPGIPHAFHMQAHLATRLGRWDKTSDRSARAIELHRAYQKEMNVKPTEDYQFTHHLEILTQSLIHDGRFREARAIKEEAWAAGFRHWLPWFRLHVDEGDWDAAQKVVDFYRKADKPTASYLAAVLWLARGEPERARPEVEVLRGEQQRRKQDRSLQLRLWETQGRLLCQTGSADEGLQLLQRAVDRAKDDFGQHAWGHGAYFMEAWGEAALACGKWDVAEEAFQEALAHDPGSVRGALGMRALCERAGRTEEASRFAALARRCWRHAEVESFVRLEEDLTTKAQRAQRAEAVISAGAR
jgi:tetratricopeptide (TPR) repeat protein